MQGRNKTNQPRHEYEDLAEGLDESTDIIGASDTSNRGSQAGSRNSDRPGDPQAQAAIQGRGGNAARDAGRSTGGAGSDRGQATKNENGGSRRASPRRVDTIDARSDDAIDLRSPGSEAEDADWRSLDGNGRLSELLSRGSEFLGSLRERSGGWLENLRSASGGMLGNRSIAKAGKGSDGEDVDLGGRRVAVLAADGVEKVELAVPVKALLSAGAQVDVISLRAGRIRSVNLHEPASRIRVDKTLLEADPNDYDALLIPGGLIGPDLLRQSSDAREFVQAFDNDGKPIASICHGVWLLASAELTKGRLMTSWPGVRDDMVNAGATWLDEEVVRDGNWVTSRGPEDLAAFVPAMLSLFAEEGEFERASTKVGKKLAKVDSSPQHAEPPQMMLDVMKRMPRPSLRTAAMLGVLGAAVLASRSMRR